MICYLPGETEETYQNPYSRWMILGQNSNQAPPDASLECRHYNGHNFIFLHVHFLFHSDYVLAVTMFLVGFHSEILLHFCLLLFSYISCYFT
jgi:hypothetical protein